MIDFTQHIVGSIAAKESLGKQIDTLEAVCKRLQETISAGGQVLSFGNGGSACDAAHLAEELVARYETERPGIRAQHLGDAGVITCWANDYSFDSVFARQIETHTTSKDAVVAISTSGNSENVLQALEIAKKIGCYRMGLLGRDGGKAKDLVDHAIVIDSRSTAHIQEAHITAIHMICSFLDAQYSSV